jgi:lantibiotic modifying enzyme
MEALLQTTIDLVLSQQQKDGGWMTGKKETGFSHGVAGIAIFLLQCHRRYPHPSIEQAIHKCLDLLHQQALIHNDRYVWHNNNNERLIAPWMHDGYVGIALCFIRAFEQFQDPLYRQIAQGALLNQPEHPIYRNFGLLNGLAGLGEVYLEAHRVFREDLWLQRAAWIAQVIGRTASYNSDTSCYWHTKFEIPSADLATGHSGPLHFLMRLEANGNIGFPML